jgi:hypothetical protein
VLRYLSNRIAFSDQALKVNLQRLENAWEEYQNSRDRDGIYRYLTAVFELERIPVILKHSLHASGSCGTVSA